MGKKKPVNSPSSPPSNAWLGPNDPGGLHGNELPARPEYFTFTLEQLAAAVRLLVHSLRAYSLTPEAIRKVMRFAFDEQFHKDDLNARRILPPLTPGGGRRLGTSLGILIWTALRLDDCDMASIPDRDRPTVRRTFELAI